MSFITHFLPRRRLSRYLGRLMHWEGPRWWANFSVRTFASLYRINLDEAEKPIEDYKSIGDFFVRKLKPGVRPLASGAWALHPTDSVITQSGVIEEQTMIQAKGLTYQVDEFTDNSDALSHWEGGFFVTYYLCPTDYHRVHSPVTGKIVKVRYVPGDLWPVNEWSTQNIPELFVKNERVVIEIETEFGLVGYVMVGATNVGFMELSFDSEIVTNQAGPAIKKERVYDPPLLVVKGQELGMFRMGSTVVVLYPKKFTELFAHQLRRGPQVKVGESLSGDQASAG